MWSVRRLDIAWSDVAAGLAGCLAPCRGPADALPCLSVRSGFDLLLRALDLPRKSEVLLSAVTIPDMTRIVEAHGLVAVPVDLDLLALGPLPAALEAAVTPRSRLLVVAHLLGSRVESAPLVEFARRHGLLLIDDLAQGFAGWPEPCAADVALYSFGPIKTATALGGALVRVRSAGLLARLQEIQASDPLQPRLAFAWRLLKFAALKAASARPAFDLLVGLLRAAGCDYDRTFADMFRGFPGPDLLGKLRQRPSAALLSLLARRLEHFDVGRLDDRAAQARRLIGRIAGRWFVPGAAAWEHTHWAVPVLAADPPRLIQRLARAGFQASQPRSLTAVAPPADRPQLTPRQAQRLIAEAVFLPVYRELPAREIERLAQVLLSCAEFASPPPACWAVSPSRPPPRPSETCALRGGWRGP